MMLKVQNFLRFFQKQIYFKIFSFGKIQIKINTFLIQKGKTKYDEKNKTIF